MIIKFFKDLIKIKKNPYHSSENSTLKLIKFLYKISDGLFLYLITKFLIKGSKKPSKFKEGFLIVEKLSDQNTFELQRQILKMKIRAINSKKTDELYLKMTNGNIDYDFYHKKEITKINFDNDDLLKNPEIAKYATDKKWIEICENILGCKAFLTGITSWITLPANFINGKEYDDIKKYESSQMWHRDCDYLRDIKVITYLTDVTNENDGPFEIIKNTHSFNFFNPFKYDMGLALRVNSNYIENKFLKKKHSFFGQKGTTFIVDTRNLHRGKTIKRSNCYRHVLQLYFTNSLFGNKIINNKLDKKWESFDIWNKAINENNSYKTCFKQ